MAAAAELLARPYRVSGVVGTGARRGRTIGFPTANWSGSRRCSRPTACMRFGADSAGGTFAGAAHVGPNATFGENARKVEVHLLDFAGDLYGQPLAVDFVGPTARDQEVRQVEH